MRFGLVTRHFKHSSHPAADRELAEGLTHALRARGMAVHALRPTDLGRSPGTSDPPAELIVSMSRSQLVLDLLEAWLNAGSRVLNSPLGVRVVLNRPALFSLLARHGLNVPRWGWQYTTDAPEDGWMKKNAWASHNGFPHNGSRADRRGTNGQKWMLLQEMVDHRHATKLYSIGGDLVLPTGVSLDLEQTRRARRLVSKCREVTGVEIFGLDVLWHDGHAVIVDVNDFPSFAGVHEASESIAEFAVRSLRARQRI